jgi:cell division protein FtsB
MARGRYFVDRKSGASIIIRVFLVLLLLFSIVFFLWSVMKYNDIMDEKKEKQEYIDSLSEQIDRLEYYVDAPIDNAYKIRMAREKLGMCFPDEIIFHTELN